VRLAVDEGRRRLQAVTMRAAMQEVSQGDEMVAAAVGRRRARL